MPSIIFGGMEVLPPPTQQTSEHEPGHPSPLDMARTDNPTEATQPHINIEEFTAVSEHGGSLEEAIQELKDNPNAPLPRCLRGLGFTSINQVIERVEGTDNSTKREPTIREIREAKKRELEKQVTASEPPDKPETVKITGSKNVDDKWPIAQPISQKPRIDKHRALEFIEPAVKQTLQSELIALELATRKIKFILNEGNHHDIRKSTLAEVSKIEHQEVEQKKTDTKRPAVTQPITLKPFTKRTRVTQKKPVTKRSAAPQQTTVKPITKPRQVKQKLVATETVKGPKANAKVDSLHAGMRPTANSAENLTKQSRPTIKTNTNTPVSASAEQLPTERDRQETPIISLDESSDETGLDFEVQQDNTPVNKSTVKQFEEEQTYDIGLGEPYVFDQSEIVAILTDLTEADRDVELIDDEAIDTNDLGLVVMGAMIELIEEPSGLETIDKPVILKLEDEVIDSLFMDNVEFEAVLSESLGSQAELDFEGLESAQDETVNIMFNTLVLAIHNMPEQPPFHGDTEETTIAPLADRQEELQQLCVELFTYIGLAVNNETVNEFIQNIQQAVAEVAHRSDQLGLEELISRGTHEHKFGHRLTHASLIHNIRHKFPLQLRLGRYVLQVAA